MKKALKLLFVTRHATSICVAHCYAVLECNVLCCCAACCSYMIWWVNLITLTGPGACSCSHRIISAGLFA